MADGGEWIGDWSVVRNYRSEMMKPGDRVVFWVSGNGRRVARGIWGIGYVTGLVQDARLAVTNSIDVDIPLFDTPVTDAELRAAWHRRSRSAASAAGLESVLGLQSTTGPSATVAA